MEKQDFPLSHPKERGSGIQARLIFILLVALVPLLLAQSFFLYERYQYRRGTELQANVEVARSQAKNFENFIQGVLHSELMVGTAITLSQRISEQDLTRTLNTFMADHPAVRIYRSIGIFFLVSLFSFIIALAISRKISSSIVSLQEHALSLGRGEYGSRADISGPGELRDLARVFRIMAERIISREKERNEHLTMINAELEARKAAEEALRHSRDTLQAVLDAAPAGVVVAEANGRILLANQASTGIFGRPITGDTVGQARGYRISQLDGAPISVGATPLPLALAGKKVSNEEFLVARADNTKSIVLANAMPLRSGNDDPWGAVAIFQDITDRKQSEEALRKSEERSRRAAAGSERKKHPTPGAHRQLSLRGDPHRRNRIHYLQQPGRFAASRVLQLG